MIVAEFESECPSCGERIEPGDQIGLVEGDWSCDQCVSEFGEDE
jgi:hypothetical protein